MLKGDIDATLKEISFEDDTMQVLSVNRNGTEPSLPLTEGPINFSVMGPAGFSHSWGVSINPKGDAYIYNRDVKGSEKASLHVKGDQHICMTKETAVSIGATSRFGPQWKEPVFDRKAVPTLSILFPPWGVMNRLPKNLARKKVELLIAGHVEKIVVVGFIILDERKKLQGNIPHFVLGKLPQRPGKVLHVVAWKEPEGGLKEGLRAALKQIQVSAQQIQTPPSEEDDLVINFQGFRAPSSAYMVAVPVKERAVSQP